MQTRILAADVRNDAFTVGLWNIGPHSHVDELVRLEGLPLDHAPAHGILHEVAIEDIVKAIE